MAAYVFIVLVCFSSIFWLSEPQVEGCETTVRAICNLKPNPSLPPSEITGTILFTQQNDCSNKWYSSFPVQVKVRISGLPATGKVNFHGMHVHQLGVMSPGCEAMGGHYNPFRVNHGARTDSVYGRHVGDFGNVMASPQGEVSVNFWDRTASLVGAQSILHRGIVLHEGQDDLGRGGNAGSLRTGNAGRRLACCDIKPFHP